MDCPDTTKLDRGYSPLVPDIRLGLPFKPTAVSADCFGYPTLSELFPLSFPEVKTSREGFLVDVDVERLRARIADYFDATLSHEEIARRYPGVMQTSGRYDARAVRDALLHRGGPDETGFTRFAYRPFDNRWLYWEKHTKLLDEKRAEYRPHVFEENVWLVTSQKQRREWSPPPVTVNVDDINQMDGSTAQVPLWLRENTIGNGYNAETRANLSATAQRYPNRIGLGAEDMFHHALATLNNPANRETNAGALRMEWPRIPMPGWPTGGADGAAEELARSASRGPELAARLDPETPAP